MRAWKIVNRITLLTVLGLLAWGGQYHTAAQDAEQAETKEAAPLARFITIDGPVDDVVHARVRNIAEDLQHQAAQQDRRAVLFLEIRQGASAFHQVQGLAEFLTSASISRVKTVAWVPGRLHGPNALLALACNEIVMHPDAELGDIGLGKPLEERHQQFVVSLVEGRHNPKLSPALARGLMDPQAEVIRLQVKPPGAEGSEVRVVTPAEAKRIQDEGLVIEDSRTIKDAGQAWAIKGRTARAHDVLAVQTLENREEFARLYNVPPEALRHDPTAGTDLKVALIKIDDEITTVLHSFLQRQIDRSLAAGANLIIFEIHSPGGLVRESMDLANRISELDPERVRTVAYVTTGPFQGAISGAAMIALGCDEIYMQPQAQIGDAGPIPKDRAHDEQFQHIEAKVVSLLRNNMRQLAKNKNRPPALAMAMVDRNLQVFQVTHRETGRVWYMSEHELHEAQDDWIKGPLVEESGAGLLLTVDGRRAHELRLAERPVDDFDELRQRLAIPTSMRIFPVGRTWADTLVFWLNEPGVTFLLLVIGIVCIYLELHLMTGLLGIISALCFSLFFWSRFLGGTSGWLEVILFLLGLGCLLMELFVIPGFGVFGVSGGLLILSSLLLASQTFGHFEPHADLRMLATSIGTLSLSIVTVLVLAAALSRYLPRIPVLNAMILSPPGLDEEQAVEPRLRPDLAGGPSGTFDPFAALVGRQGTALTLLRPAGKAQIDGQYLDVVSEGGFIEQGQTVEVIAVSGNRIVVREV